MPEHADPAPIAPPSQEQLGKWFAGPAVLVGCDEKGKWVQQPRPKSGILLPGQAGKPFR